MFTDPSGDLMGIVDWAVYDYLWFPSDFTGYTPTAGQFVYAYQIRTTGTDHGFRAGDRIRILGAHIACPESEDGASDALVCTIGRASEVFRVPAD